LNYDKKVKSTKAKQNFNKKLEKLFAMIITTILKWNYIPATILITFHPNCNNNFKTKTNWSSYSQASNYKVNSMRSKLQQT